MAHDETSMHISPDNVAWLRQRLAPHIRRTPLVRCWMGSGQRQSEVFLKCENLQLTGSFKLRGALSALLGFLHHRPDVWRHIKRDGVVTGSSGNFAQGLALATGLLDLRCTVVVPSTAAPYKIAQIIRYNPEATVIHVPYEKWRETMITGSFPELPGFFLSSETDAFVSLGNATLAVEILEDLPEVDAILVPFGGGNLAYSIASLVRQVRPDVGVYAVETASGAPLSASLQLGAPVEVAYRRSFVDGIGASFVIPEQFYRLKDKLAGALTVTPEQIAEAVSFLAQYEKLVAEGAGAAALAAARQYSSLYGWKNPCCIVSGGVISPSTLLELLEVFPAPGGSTAIASST